VAETAVPVPALDASWQRPIALVSAVVCAAVAFLILGPRPEGVAGAFDVSRLPWVNAGLNAITTGLLLCGYAAIRTRRMVLHKRLMLSAFATSTAFLASYIVYHWFSAGPARYDGPFRGVYLFVLLTHIVLAAGILPLALNTLVRALVGAYDRHRRIAPTTLAIWLYVSVTGVLITWMAHG
jgi:putative membrane protein